MPFALRPARAAKLPSLLALGLAAACASPGQRAGTSAPVPGCCVAEGRRVAAAHRVSAIATRRFTQEQLWSALAPHLGSPALRVSEIGRSVQGRPLRAVTFGRGPVTVLLWSQMHGDESAATMSVADILAWLATPASAGDPLHQRIAERLTVVFVPMLNPDGAELFQRRNAMGIDINRDARRLATPEARALKALRDSIRPEYGFNLHDQNARTLAGRGGPQVGIALLAPASDSARSWGEGRMRARRLAATIAAVVQQEIPGQVARYDDTFEPRAFGDLMQQWGTSTVLIESGALADDPEKQRLRAVNVVAMLSALDAIATGSHLTRETLAYDALPGNTRAAADLLLQGGSLVLADGTVARADMTIVFGDAVGKREPRLQEVGDLQGTVALDTLDATGMFLHADGEAVEERDGVRWLRVDMPVRVTVRRGAGANSEVVRVVGG